MNSISTDLRQRIVHAIQIENNTPDQTAKRCLTSRASVPVQVAAVTPDSFALELLKPHAVTSGQSIVLYDSSRLLGGRLFHADAVMMPRAISQVATSDLNYQ